jgi:hypothetical protein
VGNDPTSTKRQKNTEPNHKQQQQQNNKQKQTKQMTYNWKKDRPKLYNPLSTVGTKKNYGFSVGCGGRKLAETREKNQTKCLTLKLFSQ